MLWGVNREQRHNKNAMSYEDTIFYPICASIFLSHNKIPSHEKIIECKKLLKKNTGIFSCFRGMSKLSVICMLSMSDNPESKLEKTKKHILS